MEALQALILGLQIKNKLPNTSSGKKRKKKQAPPKNFRTFKSTITSFSKKKKPKKTFNFFLPSSKPTLPHVLQN